MSADPELSRFGSLGISAFPSFYRCLGRGGGGVGCSVLDLWFYGQGLGFFGSRFPGDRILGLRFLSFCLGCVDAYCGLEY